MFIKYVHESISLKLSLTYYVLITISIKFSIEEDHENDQTIPLFTEN